MTRILLRDLSPATNYALQLRSVSADQISPWSRIFTVNTTTDTIAPKKPANVVGSMSGSSFILTWDAVTQSTDNTAASDLDAYQVSVKSSGNAAVGSFITKDTKFEFTYSMNLALFGTPQPNVQMAVQALDKAGNTDGYTAYVSQTNAAPANVTGLTATSISNAISASWNANTDTDLLKYVAYVGTTSGFTPGAGTKVWEGTSTSFTYTTIQYSTDLWVKVVAVDIFGTPSATPASAGPVRPTSPTTVDSTAPAVPTGLAATLTNAVDGKSASAAVSWSAVADSDLDSYVIGYRQVASPVNDWQYTTVDKATTSTTIQSLVPYKNYDFRIRAKDFSANFSAWATIVTATAVTNTAPSVPTGLAITAARDSIQVSWNENSEVDMANNAGTYDVTIATNSGFTTGVLQYRTGTTTLAVNGLASNQIYYARVRAVDSGGLTSAYSTSVNATTSNFSGGSDGAVPVGAVTLSASAGIGYIYLSWTPLTNNDPVTYDVYMSTTNNFTTYDATTKITEVSGTSAFIDTTVAGASLAYGTTYYFKVRARDKDGSSTSVSNQASAAPVQAASTDLTPAVNTSITNAQTAADTAQASSDAADAFNKNPNFSQWSGAIPNNWTAWSGTPTKETTLVRTPPNAVRFNCTDTTTQLGIQQSAGNIVMPVGLDYVTVTVDVMLNSGTSFGGSGWLFDWTGMTGSYRNTYTFATDIPNPVAGKWYRISKVIKRAANTGGTQTGWALFLMAQYASIGSTQAVKDIIFNRASMRPSSNEEIAAYNAAPATMVTDLSDQVNSKGTDLVTNGTGLLGTNYNFSQFDYNGADSPTGASGSFLAKISSGYTAVTDELIPFDPTKNYKLSYQTRETIAGSVSKQYAFIAPFDAANLSITTQNYMWVTGTTTTLAADLKPGDTTIKLTSAANWWGQTGKVAGASTHLRSIMFWDYTDKFGKLWPVETYTRNFTGSNSWADGGVDLATNTITLNNPYSGPIHVAGTPVSNNSAGGTYIYMPAATNVTVPETWTTFSNIFSAGILASGGGATGTAATWSGGLPPGTAKIKVGWLVNYPPSNGKQAFAAISFSDASAAQATADAVKTDLATNYSNTTAMNNAILTSANGKNKITYSASVPGTAANIAGDIWFQQDGTGKIMGQWIGAGGTSWSSVTIRNEVIANLDAGKIVAGSTFTNDLNVKSTFNLGDATTPGIIKSYNYSAGTAGFKLASNGLEIVDGIIDAKAIKANSSFVTNLFIGTGGAIQSTGYTSGGTSGFQLSATGLTIKGTNNVVDAGVLKGGTITGTTINVGAGGVLNVDSTAAIKSNNYATGSTGYSLGSTGLEVNDGSIDAKTLKTNTAIIGDLTIGRSADSVGTIKSFDYVSGSAGWKIGKGLFEINQGLVRAAALQIQSGASNLEEPQYSAFEFTPSFYTGKFLGVNATPTIQTTGGVQGSQFLRVTTTATGQTSLILGDTGTDYHISVEPTKTYIISGWMKASTATAVSAYLRFKYSDGTFSTQTPVTLPASGAWVRYAFPATVPSNATGAVVQVYNTTTTAGVGVDVDGVMVEQQISSLTTPSTYVMPGMTSADGGMFRTGEIRSNATVTVNGVSQPAWSINMAGGAQFGDANLRGSLIVGPAGTDTDAGQSFIASGNYIANTTGWKMSSSGDLEANSGRIRGSLVVDGTIETSKLSVGVLRTNPINNPGFESNTPFTYFNAPGQGDTTSWRYWSSSANGVTTRDINAANSGNYRATLNINASGTTSDVTDLISSVVLLKANTTYKLTFSAIATGAGAATAPVGGKLYVLAAFGPSASAINTGNAVNQSLSDESVETSPGVFTTNPYFTVPYAPASAVMSYADYSQELTIPVGQTDLYCAIRFRNTSNPADTQIYIDDVAIIETNIGGGSELTSAGLRLFGNDGEETVALVSNRPNYFSIQDVDGNAVATIDSTGSIAGTSGAFAGNPDDTNEFGDVRGLSIGGTDVADRLSAMGQGMIARGYMSSKTFGPIDSDVGLFEVGFVASPGREYLVTMDNFYFQFNPGTASGATVPGMSFALRYTTDGSSPTVTSASLAYTNGFSPRGGGNDAGAVHLAGSFAISGASEKQVRVLFVAGVGYPGTEGAATRGEVFSYATPMQMRIFDLGPYGYENLAAENRGGGAYAGSTVVTPPATTKKTYTSTWAANGSQTRRGISGYGNYTVNTSAPSGYNLAGYYSSSNGNQYTYLGFTAANSTGGESNKTISSAISGASISKVELYVKNATFYATSGGSQRFSMTTLGSIPSSGSASSTTGNGYTSNQSFTTGQGKWITLPSSAASTISAGGRVAIIGPGSSNSTTYYSKWYDHVGSGAPALRITYTK
jgi:hypothetical protein